MPFSSNTDLADKFIRLSRSIVKCMTEILLLSSLIFAPWFWGCTWPLGMALLNVLLLSTTFFWLISRSLSPLSSFQSRFLLLILALLLLQGWIMVLTARSVLDPATGLLVPVHGFGSGLFGSVDGNASWIAMIHFTGLLGSGLAAADLGRSASWRRLIIGTMVLTAASIVLLGIVQRLTHALDIFWGPRPLDYFFGTYRNVSNAGEYVNMVIPLAAASLLFAVVKRKGPVLIAMKFMGTALLCAGSAICGSKMAPLAMIVVALIFFSLQWRYAPARFFSMNRSAWGLACVLVLISTFIIIRGLGAEVTWGRFQQSFETRSGSATFSNRLLVDQACFASLPDAGVCGFGPGTFTAIFPYYSGRTSGNLPGHWTAAHNDYLQTAMEWGWLGAGLWATYALGSFFLLIHGWRVDRWRTGDRIQAGGLIAAQAAFFLMALGDFPFQVASIQLNAVMVFSLGWSSPAWERVRRPLTSVHRTNRR